MPDPGKFQLLLRHLRTAEVIPRPADGTWPETIGRIKAGGLCEIDAFADRFFRDVLPPHFMGYGVFAFAEGREPFWLFFKEASGYVCRRLTWEETLPFCDLA